MNLQEIEREALYLSEEERATLAQRLLLSLDYPTEQEVAEDWLLQAVRSARKLDQGLDYPVPAETVRRKAMSFTQMSYSFHPAAEIERPESVAYYESKRPGLGKGVRSF